MRRLILIFCLVTSSLQGAHPFDYKAECAYIPSPLFPPKDQFTFLPQIPKVNLITGEYCEDECDLVVAGVEPLSIRRFYNHFSGHNERIYGHWRVNPETLAFFNFEPFQGYKTFVAAGEKNSSFFLYERFVGNNISFDGENNKGFTNTSSLLTGQNHPLNTQISYNKRHTVLKKTLLSPPTDYYWWEGTIKDGSGKERSFKTDIRQWPQVGEPWPAHKRIHPCSGEIERTPLPFFAPPYQTQITEERKPNGNIIRYEYEDFNVLDPHFDHELPTNYILKSIKAYSQKGLLLGSIEIDYTGHFPGGDLTHLRLIDVVRFKGSDGREASFSQPQRVIKKRTAYDTILAQVDAPGKPRQSYDYFHYLDKKRTYYTTPPNLFQVCQEEGRYLETTYDGTGKVATQSASIGLNGERIPIARYSYQNDHTIVYDGENNKTLYRYNPDKRIISIEKYDGETLYSVERNIWDPKTGNLLKKSIEDNLGASFYCAAYIYDKNHNVIEERVEGVTPIYRTYSDDGFNLKLTESDRPNKEIRYTYLPFTNLLSSEFIMLYGKIVKRTFHFYDVEIGSVCVKTIVDDGSTENPHDLTEVTFRHVTEVTPKKTLPCLGLPEEIREYADDQLLKKICYTYHPSGQIASEEHYDSENQKLYTIWNEYDAQERLIAITDPLGNKTLFTYDKNFNLISRQGPRADQRKEWGYDFANRPIRESEFQSDGSILISEKKYDKASRLISSADPSGFETCYTYDSLGRVTAIHHPDGAVEKKAYDILGNITCETDPNGHVTRKTYNFRGQPTAIYHPDGTQEHFTYNTMGGTLATHIDTHGVTTFYTYDLLDNITSTEIGLALTSATYSAFRLLSETDPTGETTYLTYDLVGRKIGERKGQREISNAYNSLGQIAQKREGEVITCFTYDLKGQLLEKKIEGVFQESYTYDEAGNRNSITTCGGTTHTTFNSRNEPIRIRDPLGNITEIAYSYANGFTKTICDPKRITKIIKHDSRKRPIDLQTKNREGKLIQREERRYDLSGNHTQANKYVYEGTLLQNTIAHSYFYDPKGRLERLIESEEKETQYLYDNKGRLSTLIKPDGEQIHREYDDLSRLVRYYGKGIDYAYFYDIKNRLIKIVDKIHQTTLERSYDTYDNTIAEKLDSGVIIRREFDPYGRRTALYLPNASTITYSYAGPYLHALSYNGRTHTYAKRNLSGKPIEITLPNQESVLIEWDPLLRWKNYYAPHFKASYSYDEVGNLTKYTFQDPIGSEEELYKYDDLHQLINENELHYSYDSLFNRRGKNEAEYSLNALLQVTNDGQQGYHYDKNGNLISDGNASYEYDLLDRLIAVNTREGRTLYTYDALNRRIAKNDEFYLWDEQQEIGMLRHNKLQELRILGQGNGAEIGAAVILQLEDNLYIPIHDHRGSLVTLLTLKDTSHSTYRYTAFGEELTHNNLSPWRFSSKRHDPESGFIYFGRRYYHPVLGRWITPDPQGFQDGPNLYTYVHNNPLLYCDPYGLVAQSFAETRNFGEFCGRLFYCFFSAIEWFGHNLIPFPVARDLIEATGRWGRGGHFFEPREYAQICPSEGRDIEGVSKPYHNGIKNKLAYAKEVRDKISETNGGVKVDLLFNPSHGLLVDFIDSILAKCGIKMAYERMCAHYYALKLKEDPDHEFDTIAHSQGATRLNNVGTMFKNGEGQHITVHAFGGATIIPRGRFKDVHNNVSMLDLVPWTSLLSISLNVAGFDSNVTFLSPTSYNPLTEHSILGNTYWQAIEDLGKKFKCQYLNE